MYGGHDNISRRQGAANLSTRDELRRVLHDAKLLHIPVWLALNARFTAAQYPYLAELCGWFADWGGTGVILQDMGLLMKIREDALPLRITASLLTVTVNADAVRLLRQLGVSRVVFPRFLRLEEIKAIAAEEPDMEYEVMGMGDGCPMIDGLCRSFHGETFEPVRCDDLPDRVRNDAGEDPSADLLWTFDTSCRAHHLCAALPVKEHPCAACAMKELEEAGIRILKFGGRGTPLEMRLKDLDFFTQAEKLRDTAQIRKLYQETYGHECHCYYS